MMRRREFLAVAGAAVALPSLTFAQLAQPKLPRIAFVVPIGFLDIPNYLAGLADFGYVDSKTAIVTSFLVPTAANGDIAAAVADAVASRPDVILAVGSAIAAATKNATSTLPVVFGNVPEPVRLGLVASLARPGGNLTGTANPGPEIAGKQLQVAKEAIPAVKRIVAMTHSANISTPLYASQLEATAQVLGLELVVVDFVDDRDFLMQFDRVAAASAQAAYVSSDVYFATKADQLADLQIKHRLPLIVGASSQYPRAMLAYWSISAAVARRTGSYVDAILKGAKPGDLPVEQPAVFDFVINATTAKALGIAIPPSVFAQATKVIE